MTANANAENSKSHKSAALQMPSDDTTQTQLPEKMLSFFMFPPEHCEEFIA